MLDASQAKDLPAELIEQRLLVRAVSVARRGDPAAAAAMLAPSRAIRAMEARAQILETASDWPAAEKAWSDYATQLIPDQGKLDDGQIQIVLRLATATTRARDDAGLAALREKYDQRVGTGPLADMFRLLTAEPVRTSADIKRSSQEATLAAALPTDLKALQPSTPRP